MAGAAWGQPEALGGSTTPPGVLMFGVPYPPHHSRLLIFIRWLLIIPQIFVLYFVTLAALLVSAIAWFAILILGRYPEGMWRFVYKWSRWNANLTAYLLMLRDDYPPFGAEGYPVQFELQQATDQSRLLIFVRWLLLIPHHLIVGVLFLGVYVVSLLAWWAILFTGHYPRGLYTFTEGVLRWSFRVHVYRLNLTDTYPPFSLD